MMRKRLQPRSDSGAILVLAILFIGVIGLMVLALLTTTTTVISGSQVKRDLVAKVSATDAGLQYGLQQVRSRSEVCPSSASGGLLNPPASFFSGVIGGVSKNIQVRVSCTVTTDSLVGSAGYALVTRDASKDTADTSGPAHAQLNISGPVYFGGNPGASPQTAQGDISFLMSDGDVVMARQGATCPPVPANLTVAPAPYGFGCSDTAPVAPANLLPPAAPAAHTGPLSWPTPATRALQPDFKPTANCAVFLPGTYDYATSANAQLALLTQNYFVSGVYYFNNVQLDLRSKSLVGGRSTVSEITEDANGGQPYVLPCSSDANAQTVVGYNAGGTTGVKIILGGNSTILADNPTGQIELFARRGGSATTEGLQTVSVMTAQQTQNGFTKSTLAMTDLALAVGKPSGGGGSTMILVVHGFVATPNASVQVRDNGIPARFFAGIDTGRLSSSTSNNVSGFAITVTSQPVIRQFRITAVACGRVSAADACTTAYDGGQNITGTESVSVNSSTHETSVSAYHVGPN